MYIDVKSIQDTSILLISTRIVCVYGCTIVNLLPTLSFSFDSIFDSIVHFPFVVVHYSVYCCYVGILESVTQPT